MRQILATVALVIFLFPTLVLTTALILPSPVWFSSARSEPNWANEADTALECSAGFFILSALGHKYEGLDTYFSKFGEVSQLLAKIYDSKKRYQNRRELLKAKAYKIEQLGAKFDQSKSKVEIIIDSCMGWSFELIKYGMEKGDTQQPLDKVMEKLYKSAARPSDIYEYPHDDKEKFHPMLVEAFEIWTKNGRITNMTVREELEKLME